MHCFGSSVGLISVRREILSSVTIVFYDKVRERNKAQRWLLLVCWGFFIWKRYNRTHFHRTILWLTLAEFEDSETKHAYRCHIFRRNKISMFLFLLYILPPFGVSSYSSFSYNTVAGSSSSILPCLDAPGERKQMDGCLCNLGCSDITAASNHDKKGLNISTMFS